VRTLECLQKLLARCMLIWTRLALYETNRAAIIFYVISVVDDRDYGNLSLAAASKQCCKFGTYPRSRMCLLDEVSLTLCWSEVWKNSGFLLPMKVMLVVCIWIRWPGGAFLTCLPHVWSHAGTEQIRCGVVVGCLLPTAAWWADGNWEGVIRSV
jgi:hypothetical protein